MGDGSIEHDSFGPHRLAFLAGGLSLSALAVADLHYDSATIVTQLMPHNVYICAVRGPLCAIYGHDGAMCWKTAA
jgi:hypothetical protein